MKSAHSIDTPTPNSALPIGISIAGGLAAGIGWVFRNTNNTESMNMLGRNVEIRLQMRMLMQQMKMGRLYKMSL